MGCVQLSPWLVPGAPGRAEGLGVLGTLTGSRAEALEGAAAQLMLV